MVHLATDVVAHGSAMTGDSDEDAFSVPGLLAAATWAIGLVIGLVAMTHGHELVAGVSLVLAILSPWFGLAWLSQSQRAGTRRQQHAISAVQTSPYAGGWPAR